MALDGRDDPVCEEGVEFGGRDHVVAGEETEQTSHVHAYLGRAAAQVVVQQLPDQTLQHNGGQVTR